MAEMTKREQVYQGPVSQAPVREQTTVSQMPPQSATVQQVFQVLSENPAPEQQVETPLKLEDIMDVVTSYKCKFCKFSCANPQDIADHVQRDHVIRPEACQTSSAVNMVNEDTSSYGQVHVNAEGLNTVHVDTGTQMTDVHGGGQGLETSSTSSSQFQMHSYNQSTQMDQGEVQGDTETAAVVHDSECGQEADIPKEVYICGQCGIGFASIDLCKQHMMDLHGVQMDLNDISAPVYEDTYRISVGTQVQQKKKPGRKRKNKFPQQIPKSPPEPHLFNMARTERTEEVDKDGEGLGKRRIRTPKALADYYYLGRRKRTYRSRRMVKGEGYELKCFVQGCVAKFRSEEALKTHQDCHNKVKSDDGSERVSVGFTCVHCAEKFAMWKHLRMHLWKDHQVDTDLLCCDDCDFRCDTGHKLDVHREIHNEDRPYECDTCGKGFKQASQLRNHQVIHMDRLVESDRWYTSKQCDICKRTFANQKCLKKHIEAVHSKIKPYVCPYCSHSTSRKAMMELHVRTHTGEKPFKCDMCAYATGDHNSLRRHRMRHTGQKPYKCQHCSYSCIQAISLKTHMRSKHPDLEGIYICSMCSYRTVNQQNFTNHMEDHKNGLVVLPTSEQVVSSPQEVITVTTAEEVLPQITTVTTEQYGNNNIVSNDASAAQLIYSALNAISQNGGSAENQQTGIPSVSSANIASVESESQDGVTTHTITFHIPGTSASQTSTETDEQGNTVYLSMQSQDLPVTKEYTSIKGGQSLIISGSSIQPAVAMETRGNASEDQSFLIIDGASHMKEGTQVMMQNSNAHTITNSSTMTPVTLTTASQFKSVVMTSHQSETTAGGDVQVAMETTSAEEQT